jgi:hypothetical protein
VLAKSLLLTTALTDRTPDRNGNPLLGSNVVVLTLPGPTLLTMSSCPSNLQSLPAGVRTMCVDAERHGKTLIRLNTVDELDAFAETIRLSA